MAIGICDRCGKTYITEINEIGQKEHLCNKCDVEVLEGDE